MNIPNIQTLLDCLLFKVTFEENFTSLNRNLEFLKLAITSINNNP